MGTNIKAHKPPFWTVATALLHRWLWQVCITPTHSETSALRLSTSSNHHACPYCNGNRRSMPYVVIGAISQLFGWSAWLFRIPSTRWTYHWIALWTYCKHMHRSHNEPEHNATINQTFAVSFALNPYVNLNRTVAKEVGLMVLGFFRLLLSKGPQMLFGFFLFFFHSTPFLAKQC